MMVDAQFTKMPDMIEDMIFFEFTLKNEEQDLTMLFSKDYIFHVTCLISVNKALT